VQVGVAADAAARQAGRVLAQRARRRYRHRSVVHEGAGVNVRRSGVAAAWRATTVGLAAWFTARGYLAAFVAWPLLAPQAVVYALVAVDATSPQPRLVKINMEVD
jgi:hypothetical protein